MAIKELENFRQKYPQYSDIDDMTLATKLSEKYPQYSDLLDKVKKGSLKSFFPKVGVEAGGTSAGDVALSTIQGTGRDIAQPALSFINQFLLRNPESISRKMGYEYPKESGVTSPTAKAISYGAGVMGGAKNPLLSGMGTGSLLMRSLKGAIAGGLLAPEDFGDMESRKTSAVVGGVLPVAGRVAGKLGKSAVGSTSKLARGFSGISSKSVKWIKERGSNKIFDKVKEQPDYIKTTLVPETYKIYEAKTSGAIAQAGKMFDTALDNLKTKTVSLPKTFATMRKTLKGYDLIDERGLLKGGIKDREVPSAVKVIAEMYEQALGEGITTKGAEKALNVNKGYFSFYRQALRSAQKGAGTFKKDIQNVIDSLYDDVESAGAKGLNKAKNLYRTAAQFEDEYGLSYDQFASKLQSATNTKNFSFMKERFKPIFGDKTDEIFNNIKDHTVAQEMATTGKTPIGLTSILSKSAKTGLRSYYEKGLPAVQKSKRLAKEFFSGRGK